MNCNAHYTKAIKARGAHCGRGAAGFGLGTAAERVGHSLQRGWHTSSRCEAALRAVRAPNDGHRCSSPQHAAPDCKRGAEQLLPPGLWLCAAQEGRACAVGRLLEQALTHAQLKRPLLSPPPLLFPHAPALRSFLCLSMACAARAAWSSRRSSSARSSRHRSPRSADVAARAHMPATSRATRASSAADAATASACCWCAAARSAACCSTLRSCVASAGRLLPASALACAAWGHPALLPLPKPSTTADTSSSCCRSSATAASAAERRCRSCCSCHAALPLWPASDADEGRASAQASSSSVAVPQSSPRLLEALGTAQADGAGQERVSTCPRHGVGRAPNTNGACARRRRAHSRYSSPGSARPRRWWLGTQTPVLPLPPTLRLRRYAAATARPGVATAGAATCRLRCCC